MTEPLFPQSETPMTPLDTVTRGFNPHAVPTTTEFPPTHPLIPTDTIEEAEPLLLPQLVTSIIPPMTPPNQQLTNSIITTIATEPQLPPEVWNRMNQSQRKHWRQRRHK
jgi:hypothetical protein